MLVQWSQETTRESRMRYDNTSDGDTVYVFPATYKEHITINTSIQLRVQTSNSTH